ncbi:YdbH domain-containing protein [Desulforhopalus vacuolatus]|uniref:intermembrane phospholipid transport protein YdbH family protein n=1 Tax=Desulforhopalus vacuolatus TaxID=40414 RepID=UPI0019654E24|nr:YdbH domain-containing protein [Desulforhopalus vacuolatus]MBM9519921.1 YdbH domain-containing protein [Desulforhopalus vacuolatus]
MTEKNTQAAGEGFRRHKLLRLFTRTLFFCTILLLCGFLLFFSLPFICNHWILPGATQSLPFISHHLEIEQFTPSIISLQGNFTTEEASLSFEGLRLNSTLKSLQQKEITSIEIEWLKITLPFADNRIVLPPELTNTVSSTTKESPDSPVSPILLPFGVDKVTIHNGDLVLHNLDTPEENIHILFSGSFTPELIETKDGKLLNGFHAAFSCTGELPLNIELTAQLDGSKRHLTAKGTLLNLQRILQFPLLPKIPALQLEGTGEITGKALLSGSTLESWQANLFFPSTSLSTGNSLRLDSPPVKPLQLALSGDNIHADFVLKNLILSSPFKVFAHAEGSLDFHKQNLTAAISLRHELSPEPTTLTLSGIYNEDGGTFASKLTAGKLQFGPMAIPKLAINLTAKKGKTGTTARLDATIPHLLFPASSTELSDVHLQMPIQYPPPRIRSRSRGELSIGNIRWQETNIGKLHSILTQTHNGLKTRLNLSSPLIKNFDLNCTGDLTQTTLKSVWQCHLPQSEFDISTLPASLGLHINPELKATGKLGGRANFYFSPETTGGSLTLSLSDGDLQQESTHLQGIQTSITLPDILRLQSAPSQRLTVEKIDAGDIKLTSAKLFWQLEDTTSILLESVQAGWCSGTIESTAMRITPEMDFDTILYCDRLRLGELLKQFGVAGASGEVSLNGRLPLSFLKKHLYIDKGFLYSSPGEQVVLHFNDPRQITAGLSGATASPYLSYSLDSLRNFVCNWTKLTFNSEGDNLLLQMQLDGKPEEPLPYGYENGQIVPNKTGSGLQHPVHFDVNFHLPLQQLFNVGTGYGSMMKNLKEGI